ncbi:hypothetical protein T01_15058 [Trichinella spiralis]|uniref:Uncharacterized protein n=1 Tax=Trichinella spiralis TaxID=6334 RepID=A0A0V1AS99_TRISP|nr:hypothetical protein T01_15058 [Trichinella spiralis]
MIDCMSCEESFYSEEELSYFIPLYFYLNSLQLLDLKRFGHSPVTIFTIMHTLSRSCSAAMI